MLPSQLRSVRSEHRLILPRRLMTLAHPRQSVSLAMAQSAFCHPDGRKDPRWQRAFRTSVDPATPTDDSVPIHGNPCPWQWRKVLSGHCCRAG